MKRAMALVAVLAAASLCGCPAAAPKPGVQPTYASLSQQVFVGCSTQACHGGLNPKGNLNLEAEKAYVGLVGAEPDIAQARAEGLLRVSPGNPDESFLMIKLQPIDKPAYGAQMPLGGRLSDAQIAAVRQWIAKGAPND